MKDLVLPFEHYLVQLSIINCKGPALYLILSVFLINKRWSQENRLLASGEDNSLDNESASIILLLLSIFKMQNHYY